MRMHRLTFAGVLCAVAAALPIAGQAQTPPGAPPAAGTMAPGVQTGVGSADLDALRYYRSSGQTAKYDAELRRLQRLYPDWTPPTLDAGDAGASDDQPLWDLLGAGRYAELEAAIATRRQSNPGWQPPAELAGELDAAVAAARLVNASDGRQWETVVRIAGDNPALLTCARVDVVWRTAEAEAELGARAAAEARFRGIVETCPDRQVRLASVQKAKAALGLSAAERLIALERARGAVGQPDDDAALAGVERDMARGRLASAAAQGGALPADALATLQQQARQDRDAALAVDLGWYDYNAGRPGAAAAWFDSALSWQPSAAAALGLVLARRDSGDQQAAERIAADWQARAPRIRAVYVGMILDRLADDPKLDDAQRAEYARLAESVQSADLADALGWRAYADGAYASAADWFARSMEWRPSPKAAEGQILALRQAGRRDEAARARAVALERYPELADALAQGGVSPSLAAAAEADDHGRCVRAALTLQRTGPLSGADAQQFGWCLLALNRPAEARRAFETALRAAEADTPQGADTARLAADARLGRAYALLGLGQSVEVAGHLARGEIADPKRREIRALVLAQFAGDALSNGYYTTALALLAERRAFAAPTRGLRAVEGWAHYNLRDHAAARRIFTELDAEFSTKETRHALSVVRDATHPH